MRSLRTHVQGLSPCEDLSWPLCKDGRGAPCDTGYSGICHDGSAPNWPRYFALLGEEEQERLAQEAKARARANAELEGAAPTSTALPLSVLITVHKYTVWDSDTRAGLNSISDDDRALPLGEEEEGIMAEGDLLSSGKQLFGLLAGVICAIAVVTAGSYVVRRARGRRLAARVQGRPPRASQAAGARPPPTNAADPTRWLHAGAHGIAPAPGAFLQPPGWVPAHPMPPPQGQATAPMLPPPPHPHEVPEHSPPPGEAPPRGHAGGAGHRGPPPPSPPGGHAGSRRIQSGSSGGGGGRGLPAGQPERLSKYTGRGKAGPSGAQREKEKERAAREEESKEATCSICLSLLSEQPACFLRCTHEFHRRCITQWVTVNSKCPVCMEAIDYDIM